VAARTGRQCRDRGPEGDNRDDRRWGRGQERIRDSGPPQPAPREESGDSDQQRVARAAGGCDPAATRRLIQAHDDGETGGSEPATAGPVQQEAVTTASGVATRNGANTETVTTSGPTNSPSPSQRGDPTEGHIKRPGTSEPSGEAPRKRRRRHDEAAQRREEGSQLQQREEAARAARAERAKRRSARRDESEATATAAADTNADSRVHRTAAPKGPVELADGGQGAAQVLRGRGRPRKQTQLPDLRGRPVYGSIVERGRRRVRNRTGRYELQYEVEFRAAPGATLQRRWVDLPGYEALLDDGKLADELEGDGE